MKLTLRKEADLAVGQAPRVNLLPPAVAEAASLRKTKFKLLTGVMVAVVIVAAAFGAAQIRLMAAGSELAAAEGRVAVQLAEQATYSEAVSAAALVDAAKQTRTLGLSTEILWDDLLDTIQGYLPEGAAIDSGTLMARAPWEPELLPGGPLREVRVGTLQFQVTSPTVLDATDIVRRLSALEGFADATPDLVNVTDGVYTTTITLNVGEDALSGRFGDEVAEEEE